MRKLYPALLIQLVAGLVLLFGDFGFDKPGRFGLSIGHFILFASLYVLGLIWGIVVTIYRREARLVLLQLLPLAVVCTYLALPPVRRDPTRYQSLVGKTKTDVIRSLGEPLVSGFGRKGGGPEEEFLEYRGMSVYLSSEGVVLRVVHEEP